jgi:hypothetical protein
MTDLRGEVSPVGDSKHSLKLSMPTRSRQKAMQFQSIAHWKKAKKGNYFEVSERKHDCLFGDRGD